nr:MAG TPA: hypothetical protein [Caudoviricetes sp.]
MFSPKLNPNTLSPVGHTRKYTNTPDCKSAKYLGFWLVILVSSINFTTRGMFIFKLPFK